MADQDMTVWEKRYKALGKAIIQFQGTLKQRVGASEALAAGAALQQTSTGESGQVMVVEGDPKYTNGKEGGDNPPLLPEEQREVQNLLSLVNCLEKFAERQFGFFYDGFATQAGYTLNPSREFPREYVFSATLNQIGEDLELLRRVADQRLSTDLGPKLRQADRLAWSALKPAVESKLIEDDNTTVMTYFQKSASIRIIPYASVALVAIPFTATEVPRDYLAIPHEVGHYVYRHGKVESKTIPQALGKKLMELEKPSPKWARRWKEEIFADLYGCVIGGPVTALSFRDLALQSSRSPVIQAPGEYLYGQFTEDDGVHPVSILRPYVYTMILREMIWRKSAELLNKEWEALPQVREATDFRTRYGSTGVEYIDLEEAEGELDKIIKAIFELLPAIKLFRSDWSNDPTKDLLNELYAKFEETGGYQETGVSKLINNTELPKPVKEPRDLWKKWIETEKFFPGIENAPPKKDVTAIDAGKAQRLEELEQEPRYTWNHIFLAGGWATKLPGAGGTGVVIPKNWRGTNQAGGPGGY